MDDSTDPLDGDLGLRVTCSPPDEGQEGEDWAPPSPRPTDPTTRRQRTQTAREDTLDKDTLARIRRTVVTLALVEFNIDAGPVRLSLSLPLE